jgi:ATP-dependent helicase/nuclease subunit A
MLLSSFTDSQQQAIKATDRNLLVSAGAGAGKTRTLVERIFQLLAGEDLCSVDRLLVVTFSRAAAQEMKGRLEERMLRGSEDPALPLKTRTHLREQLVYLPRAAISTIHSFCRQLITDYPERAGIAPNFELMDEHEAKLDRDDFLRAQTEAIMDGGGERAALLIRLLDYRDPIDGSTNLLADVAQFHEVLGGLPDPARWVREKINRGSLTEESALVRTMVESRRTELRAEIAPACARFTRFDVDQLSPRMRQQLSAIQQIALAVESPVATTLPGLPRLSTAAGIPGPQDDAFREERDAFQKRLRDWTKEFEGCTPGLMASDAIRGENLLAFYAEVLGLEWCQELFERQLDSRRLTFNHLERLAQRILLEPDGSCSDVARSLQRRLQHVLVDEYQDVNELQEQILRAVDRPAEDGRGGNFFAVGDVKQSIYEFRQADPKLFLNLYDRSVPYEQPGFPFDSRIDLRENFRTHRKLLAEFNRLFEQVLLPSTIGIDYRSQHAFKAGRSEPQPVPRKPELTLEILPKDGPAAEAWPERWSAEAGWIAKRVREIGPPWKDICILVRQGAGNIANLAQALEAAGVPLHTEAKTGFLTAIEVLEILSLLQVIDNPYHDSALLATLRGPAFRWNESELLRLREINRTAPFIENLRIAAALSGDSIQLRAADACGSIDRWQHLSARVSMGDLISSLYDEMDLLEQSAARTGGDQRRRNLENLVDRARQFDGFLRKGLSRFLRFLNLLIERGEDFAPPAKLPENADVVRIMTIHKSKGMEFPVVIYAFTGVQFSERSMRGQFLYDRIVGMATKLRDERSDEGKVPTPWFNAVKEAIRRRCWCEELRLMYVALTRAQESVLIIGSEKEDERTSWAEAAPLTSHEIFRSKCALEWMARGLGTGSPEVFRSPGVASSGILSIRIVSDDDLLACATPEGEASEPDRTALATTPDLAPFRAAAERIVAAQSAPAPPQVRTKVSVSELKRAFDATRDPISPPWPKARAEASTEAPTPRFLIKEEKPDALQRGTITHRFLANMRIHEELGPIVMKTELDRLVEAGILTPEQGAVVPLRDIFEFLNSPLGTYIRRLRGALYRERPFTIRLEGARVQPSLAGKDVIVQGVLDILYRGADGWVIVDYKTDYLAGDPIALQRAIDSYRLQVRLYRLLVETTFHEPVAEVWLVFLREKQTILMDPDPSDLPWSEVLAPGLLITEVDAAI